MAKGLVIAVLSSALAALIASVAPALAGPPVPAAFQGFCARYAGDCRPQNVTAGPFQLTSERLAELRQVNDAVNHAVREATDAQIYGREDVWTLPTRGVGDCEDFALEKRHELIAMGWPSSALLITVVRDQNGEGHAVLSAVFDKGEYILDNRSGSVRPRSATLYTYYIRQSSVNPTEWVCIGSRQPSVQSVAAVR